MSVDFAAEPKYVKVAQHLRELMLSGSLQPGDRLSSFPEMKALGVGQNTLERAHRLLEEEGLIVRERGRGVFVSPRREKAQAQGVIGVLGAFNSFPQVSPQPFGAHFYSSHLLEGIQVGAAHEKMQVLLVAEPENQAWEKMDGVICLPPLSQPPATIPATLPFVTTLHPQTQTPGVSANDFEGARQAVAHFVELGHRRIAFLSMMWDAWSQQRLAGYHQALQEAGIQPNPKWVRALKVEEKVGRRSKSPRPRFSFHDSGRERMEEWLAKDWQKLGCTALFVHNDQAAIGAMETLQAAGLSVPGDVSVIGFDGTEICDYVSPKLTSVAVPLREIGEQAAHLLLQTIRTPKDSPPETAAHIVLPTTLQIRQSTVPPR